MFVFVVRVPVDVPEIVADVAVLVVTYGLIPALINSILTDSLKS